jgi:tetratricopeptide (TPR) repeat protein
MSRRRKNAVAASVAPPPAAPGARGRVWAFRLTALLGIPALFFLLLEVGLRGAGYGVSTDFLQKERVGEREVLVPNLRFAERFFGKAMARQPDSFLVDRSKPPGTLRIVVFGESAAFGDPDADYGLCRVLRGLLELRYPGRRFEVVNAAMTGINSHAILPIARDCVALEADAWVLYMGNNEVVGPFGAGTVFGPQVPALPLIRQSLALKATRTGQMLDALKARLNPPPESRGEWGGMSMFIEQKVAADDPRMAAVHANFRRNLEDIVRLAGRENVPVVLSTVAVNLKDCAPFASLHRPGLGAEPLARWQQAFAAGCALQDRGDWNGALEAFMAATGLDDTHAELRFRMGQCLASLGRDAEAVARFHQARDLDALRFRCDGAMNQAIRDVAGRFPHAVLVDAARVLDAASPGGASGAELFHEHVHLRFEGNHLLARALAEQLAGILPEESLRGPVREWATARECAEHLAFADWNRLSAALAIHGRLNDPPFTLQADHAAQLDRVRGEIRRLTGSDGADALRALEPMYRRAIEHSPRDPVPLAQYAWTLGKRGEFQAADDPLERALALNPFDAARWLQRARLHVDSKRPGGAIEAFRRCLAVDPGNPWAANGLGQVLASEGRLDEAERAYGDLLRMRPRFGPAHLGLGHVLERLGRTNEAGGHFEEALRHRALTAESLGALARFCFERGRHAEAATHYLDALRLAPGDPLLHLNLGRTYRMLGRADEARRLNLAALELAPGLAEAQFLVGLDLARTGDESGGAARFAEAVRLQPAFIEARINYGVALHNLRRQAEALEQFEAVLRLDPANATARRFVVDLRGAAAPAP